jgi:deoxyribodipyrimidine photo-lyase
VVPVFILDDEGEGGWVPGAASRWWLHHSLEALGRSLRDRGSRLVLARGASPGVLSALARRTGARTVYWNRRYEPAAMLRERAVEDSLSENGVEARSFNSSLLFDPHGVANRQGGPFRVFTPYWRRCLELPVEPPVRFKPRKIAAPRGWPESLDLDDLALASKSKRASGLAECWLPGERAGVLRLRRFITHGLDTYSARRDRPDLDGTSCLSPRLHFGEVGPRQVWSAVRALSRESGVFPNGKGAEVFLSELGWREFSHHLLVHFPNTPESPFRPSFARFPWAADPGGRKLEAWRTGRTGYPIVDAGMRQLLRTGWMHNRVRMIAASFLVKHLGIPWSEGVRWFWNTLVDADLANNTLGWQWSAGCGADAAPFFRIFSPVRQGERFDPEGRYVRKWVPELAELQPEFIHRPWEAPTGALVSAGVRLGNSYPRPIVDHTSARAAALRAFKAMASGDDS